MTPIDHALTPLRKYADFSGRARRAEYWWFYLLIIVGYIVATIVDSLLGMDAFGPYGIVTAAFGLAMLIPSLAAGVRRLHDTDRSGWWLLIALVPLVGGIVLLVFFVLEGTHGDNRFGPDPKAAEHGGRIAAE